MCRFISLRLSIYSIGANFNGGGGGGGGGWDSYGSERDRLYGGSEERIEAEEANLRRFASAAIPKSEVINVVPSSKVFMAFRWIYPAIKCKCVLYLCNSAPGGPNHLKSLFNIGN